MPFSNNYFNTVPCPVGPDKCKVVNCVFSHKPRHTAERKDTAAQQHSVSNGSEQDHGDAKRRKLNDSSVDSARSQVLAPTLPSATKTTLPERNGIKSPASILKEITPPPIAAKLKPDITNVPSAHATKAPAVSTQANTAPRKVEALLPRRNPASNQQWMTRVNVLKALHDEFVRLNKELAKSQDPKEKALQDSPEDLIRLALDLEEAALTDKAKSNVYVNVMKLQIVKYKRMPVAKWIEEREQARSSTTTAEELGADGPVKLDINLTEAQQFDMLKRFVLKPTQMSRAGFILSPATDAQIEEASKIVQVSDGFETCDRCGTRFRVLQEPIEGEAARYTTGGACSYHWGRPVMPPREQADKIAGPREALHPCCHQPRGSPGCTTQESHVFKVGSSDIGRLAKVLQFEPTPINTKVGQTAIAFDCEMGYTTCGMEVIRVSACRWPSNEALIDVLVKPVGKILDLNTKFSGVTHQQFYEAEELKVGVDTPLPDPAAGSNTPKLKIASNPATARQLLTSHISPNSVLIGHAIDNDLNVLRLIHPAIVDTSLLFTHAHGLPYRYKLQRLAKDFLNLDIQIAGAAGHDSMEDSRATGDLVRFKIMKEWKRLQLEGWTAEDGKFYKQDGMGKKVAPLPPYGGNQGVVKKRKAEQAPGAGEVGETAALRTLIHEKIDNDKMKVEGQKASQQ